MSITNNYFAGAITAKTSKGIAAASGIFNNWSTTSTTINVSNNIINSTNITAPIGVTKYVSDLCLHFSSTVNTSNNHSNNALNGIGMTGTNVNMTIKSATRQAPSWFTQSNYENVLNWDFTNTWAMYDDGTNFHPIPRSAFNLLNHTPPEPEPYFGDMNHDEIIAYYENILAGYVQSIDILTNLLALAETDRDYYNSEWQKNKQSLATALESVQGYLDTIQSLTNTNGILNSTITQLRNQLETAVTDEQINTVIDELIDIYHDGNLDQFRTTLNEFIGQISAQKQAEIDALNASLQRTLADLEKSRTNVEQNNETVDPTLVIICSVGGAIIGAVFATTILLLARRRKKA
jgi:polyhydroxyalkanoate synthesis regulator phasin